MSYTRVEYTYCTYHSLLLPIGYIVAGWNYTPNNDANIMQYLTTYFRISSTPYKIRYPLNFPFARRPLRPSGQWDDGAKSAVRTYSSLKCSHGRRWSTGHSTTGKMPVVEPHIILS